MVDVTKEIKGKDVDTFCYKLLSIYDCLLGTYSVPFAVSEISMHSMLSSIVNDVQSQYYNKESDYRIVQVGEFDETTGIVHGYTEHVMLGDLSSYIDTKQRNLQTIIRTLNYLPTGYFKMPEEQKKDIQQSIDESIKKYVSDYVIPDLDTNDIQRLSTSIDESSISS